MATFKLLKVIDKSRHAGHGTSVNKLLWTDYQDQLEKNLISTLRGDYKIVIDENVLKSLVKK